MPPAPADEPAPTEVVAIDGPSGAGKSTVARRLAALLGYAYLDTGAMYRAVTWHFLSQGCAPLECHDEQGEARMRKALASLRIEIQPDGRLLANGRDVSGHLRSREVEAQVSAVAALPFVRAAMRDLQRQVASRGPAVVDGRDMATAVFPQARWKIYLDASAAERARRRQREFEARGRQVSEQEVREEIDVRDHLDSTRQDAPLRKAADARLIDTTGLDIDQVVAAILAVVRPDGGR